jgi:hypothetical protein
MLISGKRATVKFIKQFPGFEKFRKEAALLFNEMIYKLERGDFSIVHCKRILKNSKHFRYLKLRCKSVCRKPNVEENEIY